MSNNEKNSIILTIKKISTQEFWIENIINQKIIIENKIIILKDALKVITDCNHSSELDLDINIVFKASKALYTAQKCKYSNLIIHAFRIFFESISSCQKLPTDNSKNNDKLLSNTNRIISLKNIIKRIVELKKYIAKFIYNIYHLMNLSSTLKSSDHTLIKSLLSINLYLDHIKIHIDQHKDDESELIVLHSIDVQKVIAQMINLVERFRCKHCYIENYYDSLRKKIICTKVDDTANNSVHNLIEETLNNLENYYNDRTLYMIYLNYDILFSIDLYDQKYMLLEDIFNIFKDGSFTISDLVVEWKNATKWPTLNNVMNEVKSTYNLQNIFEYQVLLIEVIKSIFYIKCMKKELVTSIDDIVTLLHEFDEFINTMIPKNYPTNMYYPINQFRNSLYNLILTKSISVLSIFSVQQLRTILINTTWVLHNNCETSNIIITTIESLSMKELVSRIAGLENFKIFMNIFEELSYESNTLSNYDLQTVNTLKRIENDDNNIAICKYFSSLREKLLLFQMLIVGFQASNAQRKIDDSVVKRAKAFIFEILMHIFQTYINHDTIKKIILPLMIHFKYNKKTNENLKILLQVLFLNINIIEHFELNNCDSAKYSIDVYYNKIKDVLGTSDFQIFKHDERGIIQLNNLFWDSKESIMTNMIESNTNFFHKDSELSDIRSMVIDRLIQNAKFGSCSSSESGHGVSEQLFLWDGSMESVESVYSVITRGVIDFQYLVALQCSIVKWFISQIIENILKVKQICSSCTNKGFILYFYKNQIKKYTTEFEEIPFSKSLKMYLHNTFHSFNVTSDNIQEEKSLTESFIETSMLFVNIDRFISSQPLNEENTSQSIALEEVIKINTIIENNIKFLKGVVKKVNDYKYISEDVQFSTCIFV